MSAPQRLSGKVIVVTGGTSHIGKACAERILAEGGTVIVTGRDAARGVAAERELRAAGLAHYVQMDVTAEADWLRLTDQALRRYGRLDGLVNNAGDSIQRPIETLGLDTLWYLLRTNLESTFLGIKHGMPAIRRSGGGSIVSMSSVASLKPRPQGTGYAASKASLNALSHAAALEGAEMPTVRVNVVYPGLIWGQSMIEARGGMEPARRFRAEIEARTPLKMVGDPADVAGTVAWLLSDQSRSVTGTDIVIDGGFAIG